MFDWNDEELNIIWGEAGGSDDHIVPYPDGPDQVERKPPILFGDYNKKKSNQEISDVTPIERKKPTISTEHGTELECSSKFDTNDLATGVHPPSLNAGKANNDSKEPPASNKMTETSKSCSSRVEMAHSDKESENFQNETEVKEEGDLVDYGWANIGSFDDLDRIFSNSDPIFGDSAVGNTDELWSSSKDEHNSSTRATLFSGDSSDLEVGAMRNPPERYETEYLDLSQSFPADYQNLNEITTHAPRDVQTHFKMSANSQVSGMQHNDGSALIGKGNRKKRALKGQKLEKCEVRQRRELCSAWSSSGSPVQFNVRYAPSMVKQQPLTPSHFPRPEPLKHIHSSGPLLASPMHGNMVNQHPTLSVLPQFHPGDRNYKPECSSYEVSSGNVNSLDTSSKTAVKPPSMTPQEKIEKLRRRQQMRAILAIQKQRQQFSNQVSAIDNSTMEGGKIEVDDNVTSFPSLGPNSPIEQDNSGRVDNAVFGDFSVEGSILHQLQQTIDKLGIQLRLCIRDSLFRLAQSAKERQYCNDTSISNPSSKDDVLSKIEPTNPERFTRMPDVETETNPIDRTVAHLLFHRPLEFSGKPAEMPKSLMSVKLPYEREATLPMGYFLGGSESTLITSPHGSKTLSMFSEGDLSKKSPCLDTSNSRNASNTEVDDEKMTEMKASKPNEIQKTSSVGSFSG